MTGVTPVLLVDESFDAFEESDCESSDDEDVVTVDVVGALECESATPWAIARPPPAAVAAVKAAAASAVLCAASNAARVVDFTKASVASAGVPAGFSGLK